MLVRAFACWVFDHQRGAHQSESERAGLRETSLRLELTRLTELMREQEVSAVEHRTELELAVHSAERKAQKELGAWHLRA